MLILLIISVIIGIGALIIYYFSTYKNRLEGHNSDKIYMTWREYRKFSKLFPNRYYIGHNLINYSWCKTWEQLFFVNRDRYNNIHLMPIKFHFFTGYIPWVFYSIFHRINTTIDTQKAKKKELYQTRSIMLSALQKDVEKELKEAQKEINKAKEMNEKVLKENQNEH